MRVFVLTTERIDREMADEGQTLVAYHGGYLNFGNALGKMEQVVREYEGMDEPDYEGPPFVRPNPDEIHNGEAGFSFETVGWLYNIEPVKVMDA